MTTISYQTENNLKSVFSRAPHSPKIKKYLKSVLTRPPHPTKVHIIQKQFCQDHHSIPRWKLQKVSLYRTITPSQGGNYPKTFFSRSPHPPKVKTFQNQSLQHTATSSKGERLLKITPSGPPHPPKVEISKISPSKTTIPFHIGHCPKSVLARPAHPL